MAWFLLRRQVLDGLRGVRLLVVSVVVQYVTAHFASSRLTGSAPTLLRDVMLFSPDGTGVGLHTMVLPFLAALLGGVSFFTRHRRRQPSGRASPYICRIPLLAQRMGVACFIRRR